MNKKGQMVIYGIMMMIFAFVIVTILTQPLRELIDINRDADHLNCSSDSLSTGTVVTCLVIDLYLPYFIGTVIFLSGGYLTFKKLKGE